MKPKKIGNKTHNIEKLDYVKMRIAGPMEKQMNNREQKGTISRMEMEPGWIQHWHWEVI